MTATRIRITSLETPEDCFTFEAPTLALAVAKCVTELADVWTFVYDEELAKLLKTIAKAIESAEGAAREWDFSSPGDAYKVEIEEFEAVETIQVTEITSPEALALVLDAVPVPQAKLITAIQQRILSGDCSVYATFSDRTHSLLFSYYIDELSFSDSEFIGLTRKEAMALRRKKDVAYLQS